MTDANDILMGSGAPTAKFEQVGAMVTGTLTREPEARQQRDFRTQTPETWKDGSPKMMIVAQLATTLRDPQRPDDDGTRSVYIQGKYLTDAVRQAVRAAGANGLHTGGTLTIQYIADGPAEAGLNPPKLYAASYVPPAVSFNGVTAPAAMAQPAQQPVYQQPVQQQVAAVPPAAPAQQPMPPVQQQVAASVLGAPAGVDAAVWARLGDDQKARLVAAMGVPVTAQQAGY